MADFQYDGPSGSGGSSGPTIQHGTFPFTGGNNGSVSFLYPTAFPGVPELFFTVDRNGNASGGIFSVAITTRSSTGATIAFYTNITASQTYIIYWMAVYG